MKTPSAKARLLKKFESYVNFSQIARGPSESFLNIKPFIKQISRIFVPEAQSAKISPHHFSQATLSHQKSKPLLLLKKPLINRRTTEVKSESTMASLHCYFTSELSKSPFRSSNQKASVTKIPKKSSSSEKVLKMYRVKSSKIPKIRNNTDSFQNSLNEYFFGVSLPRRKSSNEYYKTCNLEFTLQGATNSLNCMQVDQGKVWTGDSSGKIRTWLLPVDTPDPYMNSAYIKGSKILNNSIIGTHKKPVKALCRAGKNLVSASQDGVVKLWDLENFEKILKSPTGLKSIISLPNGKLITCGNDLSFWDLSQFSQFRGSLPTKPMGCLCLHSEFIFISGSDDCKVQLWDIRASRNVNNFEGHNDVITGIAVTSNNSILSCSDDYTLREWDIRKAEAISVKRAKGKLKSITVKDGFIITGGDLIRVWQDKLIDEIRYHKGSIKEVSYCQDKNLIFAAGYDGVLSAWSSPSKSSKILKNY